MNLVQSRDNLGQNRRPAFAIKADQEIQILTGVNDSGIHEGFDIA